MRFSPAPAKNECSDLRRQSRTKTCFLIMQFGEVSLAAAHRAANLIQLIHADAKRGWVWLGGETWGREEVSVAAAADAENPSCGILGETDQRGGADFHGRKQSASAGLLSHNLIWLLASLAPNHSISRPGLSMCVCECVEECFNSDCCLCSTVDSIYSVMLRVG